MGVRNLVPLVYKCLRYWNNGNNKTSFGRLNLNVRSKVVNLRRNLHENVFYSCEWSIVGRLNSVFFIGFQNLLVVNID